MQLTNRNIRTTIRYGWLDMLDWFDRQNANVIGLLITALLSIGLIATIVRMRSMPAAVAPAPVIIIATPRAEVLPTPAAQPAAYAPVAPRMVVAFAAPNGDVLGPIEAPDLGALVARWGDQWVATMHDNNMVWIRVSELGGSIANVQPQAPQMQPQVQPIYQVVNAPPPAPEQPAEQQPAAAPIPAPQAQPAAPTMTLREALDRTNASLQGQGGSSSTSWQMEHCVGTGANQQCTP